MSETIDLTQFFQAHPSPMVWVTNGKIKKYNNAFVAHFKPVSKWMNKSIEDFLEQKSGERITIVKEESIYRCRLMTRKGMPVRFFIRAIDISDESRIFSFQPDWEHLKHFHQVTTNEHNLRLLASNLPMTDVLLISANNVVELSEGAALRAFGTNRKKLENRSLSEILPSSKLHELEMWINQARQREAVDFRRELNGRYYNISIISIKTMALVSEDTPPVMMLTRDITESLEAQKIGLEQAKRSLSEKMARIVAHEVRNPLMNIQLALDQLVESVDMNEDVEFNSEIINRNIERIRVLVEQLMQPSRSSELKLEYIPLIQVLEESKKLAQDRMELKGIAFETQFSNTDLILPIDFEKLTTALLNILINASEAIEHDHGKIRFTSWTRSNQVIIAISDNGSGMGQSEAEQIFEPFHSNKNKGMGLGLTATSIIVKAHSGSIQVKSAPEKGTTFYIHLPIVA